MANAQAQEQQAIAEMTGANNGNNQQHIWMPTGVEAFNPDAGQQQSQQTQQLPAQTQQPVSPDFNVDGKTDEQFFQELSNQQAAPQQTQETNEVQEAQAVADAAERIQQELLSQENTQEEQPVTEAQETSEDKAPVDFDFDTFSKQFEKQYGVPLSETVEAAKNIQGTFERVQEAAHQVQLRMTELELMQNWGVNKAEVQNRLSQVARVYRTFNEDAKQRLRQMGETESVLYLWNGLNPQPTNGQQPQSVVPGRAAIANTSDTPQITPELIAVQDDDEFFRRLSQFAG